MTDPAPIKKIEPPSNGEIFWTAQDPYTMFQRYGIYDRGILSDLGPCSLFEAALRLFADPGYDQLFMGASSSVVAFASGIILHE